MASRGSENGVPAPVNDSIDELLDGLPAEPMLPKKRAKPIDHSAPPPSNRRLDDHVAVRVASDPRDRVSSSQGSSTAGGAFLQANATRQRAVVAVMMMIGVLGIYAFVRHAKKESAPIPATTAQNVAPTATTTTATTALAPDVVPPPPIATIVDPSPTLTAKSGSTATHKTSKPHADSRVPTAAPAAVPSAS
ncbi:MAG: hypothetical protein ABI461_05100, partial [Polyangiaceae bacterium]